MIIQTVNRAMAATRVDRVVVATDDVRIRDVVTAAGGFSVMTDPEIPSGSDRVAVVARDAPENIVVNLQGDEPFIDPGHIDAGIDVLLRNPGISMATLAAPVQSESELWDPNVVKVLVNRRGDAVYFSRVPIPYPGNQANLRIEQIRKYRRHVGIYFFRTPYLLRYVKMAQSFSEKTERLEQLRVLDAGDDIRVVDVDHSPVGVDTPEDLKKLEENQDYLNL